MAQRFVFNLNALPIAWRWPEKCLEMLEWKPIATCLTHGHPLGLNADAFLAAGLPMLDAGIQKRNHKGVLMNPKMHWDGTLRVPQALKLGHDDVRAELLRAISVPGPIGTAAERVGKLCLPHFELEEATVFPVFGVLRDLASGEFEPDMAMVLPLISDFDSMQQSLIEHHDVIESAVWTLLVAAHKEDNREVAEFAYCLRAHEKLESEIIFPTVFLIRDFVQQKLGM
jgi:hypothetical protein